ncbi:anti-sigma factor [Profundibacterium mesophilum]|uniref:Regulator of SigK n=1 Tax=Profundibacterium mesophilum KAUST100406-0324 TaxID=1037889 RepID=A0A921NY82_9RHOB|nr:anti-sigma factor [Profundibacterium mesophilum]KAF0677560.1 uncharacterized protein PMES_00065 [Profundibacterium mesophilum KAUST100406-0324]
MTQLPFPGDDASTEAAEYALHLMGPGERAEFEARLAVSGALRAELARWQEAFVALAADIVPVAPPAALRPAIEGRIFGKERRRWSLPGLVGGTLGGGLVAGAVLVVAVLVLPQSRLGMPEPGVPERSGGTVREAAGLGADLASEDGALRVAVRLAADGEALTVTRASGAPAPGRALELWLIAETEEAPISLGVLPDARTARLGLPPALAAMLGTAVLAISDEPEGGSPTGAPTGAVLAAGPITPL